MARRTPPTAPKPLPSAPSTRRPSTTEDARDLAIDIDVDAERDADGELPDRLRVTHTDASAIERDESERALEARAEPDGSLEERLERLEHEIDEIRERLDEDDDERLHSRDLGSVSLVDTDERKAP